jgi:hypothetical protein
MESMLADMFEQARTMVEEADRKLAEEKERQQTKEREGKLMDLTARVEAAFDFTSREKLELDPRLDVEENKAAVEFVVRSLRAIFVLTPDDNGNKWALSVLDDGRDPQALGEFEGGTKSDAASRRLAAARVVAAIGNWTQKIQPAPPQRTAAQPQPRWKDQPAAPPRPEPTYGTFGKFLGY